MLAYLRALEAQLAPRERARDLEAASRRLIAATNALVTAYPDDTEAVLRRLERARAQIAEARART
jgi:hypothetical protein